MPDWKRATSSSDASSFCSTSAAPGSLRPRALQADIRVRPRMKPAFAWIKVLMNSGSAPRAAATIADGAASRSTGAPASRSLETLSGNRAANISDSQPPWHNPIRVEGAGYRPAPPKGAEGNHRSRDIASAGQRTSIQRVRDDRVPSSSSRFPSGPFPFQAARLHPALPACARRQAAIRPRLAARDQVRRLSCHRP